MSANRLNLKSPPVIAVVVVVLAVVVVINLRTFGVSLPGWGDPYMSGAQHPPVPMDLQLSLESSLNDLQPVTHRIAGPKPDLIRDPFLLSATVGTKDPPTWTTPAARRDVKPAAVVLSCSAVLLGGTRPTALIGGEAYGPGDLVGDYRIAEVTATEVILRKDDGRALTLKVGPDSQGEGSFKVVTSVRSSGEESRTQLVEHR